MASSILPYLKTLIDQPIPNQAPPFTKWLNGTLRKAEEGHVVVDFVVREEMTNPLGILHGGVQAAILDEVMGLAVATLEGATPSVTLNLSIDYIRKAPLGETVTASVQVIRHGRQVINVTGQITSSQGELIAMATSNLVKIEQKPS